jgi:glycosyltransferase involved in cell wall biosynthesis
VTRSLERVVTLPAAGRRRRGRALVSYLREPATWRGHDTRLRGHTNKWESREIAVILRRLGFAVDIVDFNDHELEPDGRYDVVLGLDGETSRLADLAGASLRLLHLTGAYGPFQNAAELGRIAELEQRRGVRCEARRLVADVDGAERALREADACSLLGNAWTLGTYPADHHAKITPIPVSGTVPAPRPSRRHGGREFLWFFGSGAVHKGLDRALEAFAATPELTLHVVGNVAEEADFWAAYAVEAELPNTRFHGFLDPGGRAFRRATSGVFCVVAPSCSEGTSPATVTMLQAGLLPLISHQTGVDVPDGCGLWLETCEAAEIAAAARVLAALPDAEVGRRSKAVRAFARERHSRTAFSTAMRRYLEAAVGA